METPIPDTNNMSVYELRILLEWLEIQANDTSYIAKSHPDKWERERAYNEWTEVRAKVEELRAFLRPKLVA